MEREQLIFGFQLSLVLLRDIVGHEAGEGKTMTDVLLLILFFLFIGPLLTWTKNRVLFK